MQRLQLPPAEPTWRLLVRRGCHNHAAQGLNVHTHGHRRTAHCHTAHCGGDHRTHTAARGLAAAVSRMIRAELGMLKPMRGRWRPRGKQTASTVGVRYALSYRTRAYNK